MNGRQLIVGSLVALLVILALGLAVSLGAVFVNLPLASGQQPQRSFLPQLPMIPDLSLRLGSAPYEKDETEVRTAPASSLPEKETQIAASRPMELAIPGVLIPLAAICFPILGLVAILGFVIFLRYLRMKETAMLLDRGVPAEAPAQQRANRPPRLALFLGIIVSMIGLALGIALYPIGIMAGSRYPLAFGPWMIPGLLPIFIGVALILWHLLSNPEQNRKER